MAPTNPSSYEVYGLKKLSAKDKFKISIKFKLLKSETAIKMGVLT